MTQFSEIFRPKSLDEFIGQKYILNPNSFLIKSIQNKTLSHLFLYGSSGVGKTTLANIIANELGYDFFNLNATSLSIKEIRDITKKYINNLQKPIIFIDEIHRLSKNQQEVLLPIMEQNQALIIGASTENLNFSLTNAIKSRATVLKLYPLTKNDLEILLNRVISRYKITIDNQAKEYLFSINKGDARSLLIHLELAYNVSETIDLNILKSIKDDKNSNNKIDDSISNIISAMIKSIRGTDIDASLYYLFLLIEKGEKADYIARRLVILASEDIGNANPNALNLSVSTLQAVKEIGYPEAKIILTQCVIYLTSCPKSNSVVQAIDNFYNYFNDNETLKVPNHLKFNSNFYKNPHDFGGYIKQNYLTKTIQLFQSKTIGFEKKLLEWVEKIKTIKGD
jgi:putative ATPase